MSDHARLSFKINFRKKVNHAGAADDVVNEIKPYFEAVQVFDTNLDSTIMRNERTYGDQ